MSLSTEALNSKNLFYAKVKNYIFLIKPNEKIAQGSIAIGKVFRGMIALSGTGNVEIEILDDVWEESKDFLKVLFCD